jgi:hypothetical protein
MGVAVLAGWAPDAAVVIAGHDASAPHVMPSDER